MQRVLVYENRKTNGPLIWDASSPALERGAFLDLFNYLNREWEVYSDLIDLEEPKKPTLTLEQIEGLTEGRVKEEALREHKEYKSGLHEFHKSQLQQKLYEKSKVGDANAVKKLLNERKTYEYEHWTLCDVDSKEA
jgi:hypothetical protein